VKRKLITLLILLLTLQLCAIVHTIGTGSSSQSNQPLNTVINYGWSKALYKSAELSAAGLTNGSVIYGLGFEISSSTNLYQLRNQKLYIKNSVVNYYNNSESYPNLQDYTLVFDADLAISAPGWFYVCWDQAFVYTGHGLEIVWENHSGQKLSSRPSFTSTTFPSGQFFSSYKHDDDAFPTVNGVSQNSRANLRLISSSPEPPVSAQILQVQNGSVTLNPVNLAWHSPSGQQSSWDVYLGTSSPPPLYRNQSSNLLEIDLEPGRDYFWKIVPRNVAGEAQNNEIWSFRTAATNQLAESFEESILPPSGWLCDPGVILESSGKAYHGSNAALVQANSVAQRIISPLLRVDEESILQFWAMTPALTGNGRIRVSISTDGSSWQELAIFTMPSSGNWTCFTLESGTLSTSAIEARIALDFYSVGATTGIFLDHLIGPMKAASLVSPQNPQILRTPSEIILSWNPVPGAGSYLIETSLDPAREDWSPLTECENTEYRFASPESSRAFYRILAQE